MNKQASIHCEKDRLQVAGEINFVTAVSLWQESLPLLAKSNELIFNFSQVTTSNSAALALLLEWLKYAKQNNKSISFEQLPEQLVSIAKVAGLTNLI
jgi:phospholipid transport system transporter-binding protein